MLCDIWFARGTCRLYGTGGFATGEPSDGSLDYAYISNPLPVNSPNQLTAMCSTKCPGADGGVHRSNSRDTQDTFEDCIDACFLMSKCHSVD
ncbi:hypothetical protein N7509_012533 [Penicillium cosmopolitanum]|uniref:Apple domain-containing protein n=1 Tax=Penicillium cosmopolitanum TaxID=1131564 RepID=A0A9W9SLF8_9EURO|nr:uncharacterized protein N7509_012533 [Penicillium cosmopolitanum]KAJ5379414.1 hypothetical protein N7509_012533 [Penicillium cosmopolitanum]